MKDRKKSAAVLGVEDNASTRQIRRAFRQQAMRRHPDKNGNTPEAADDFRQLCAAYQELLKAAQEAPAPRPAPRPSPPPAREAPKEREAHPAAPRRKHGHAGPSHPSPALLRSQARRWLPWAGGAAALLVLAVLLAGRHSSKIPAEAMVPEAAAPQPEAPIATADQASAAANEKKQAVSELVNQGIDALNRTEGQRAEEILTRAIERDPMSEPALRYRGFAQIFVGKHEKAVTDFEAALAIDDKIANTHYGLAMALLETGHLDRAWQHAERAVSLDGKNPQNHLARAMVGIETQRYEEARADLELTATALPANPEVHFQQGRLLARQNQLEKASAELETALRLSPNLDRYVSELARVRFLQRNYEAAASLYTRAIALTPSAASPYLGRSTARMKRHQLPEALADLNYALTLDPSRPVAFARRAQVYLQMSKLELALADAEKGVQHGTSPTDPPEIAGLAYCARGEALLALSKPREALEDLNRGIALRPRDPDCLGVRAEAHSRLGRANLAALDREAAKGILSGEPSTAVPAAASNSREPASLVAAPAVSSRQVGVLERIASQPPNMIRNKRPVPGSEGMPMLEGDELETGSRSGLDLRFSDEILVRLGVNTRVKLLPEAEKGNTRLELLTGTLRILVPALGDAPHAPGWVPLRLLVPGGSVAVEKGELLLSAQAGVTELHSLNGSSRFDGSNVGLQRGFRATTAAPAVAEPFALKPYLDEISSETGPFGPWWIRKRKP